MPRPLLDEQIVRLIAAAPSFEDKLLIGLLVGTNRTLDEVLALRWMDLLMWPPPLARLIDRLAGRPADYLFSRPGPRRHMSPTEAARSIRDTSLIVGMSPHHVTPAALHACDPRRLAPQVGAVTDAVYLEPPRLRPEVEGSGLRLRIALVHVTRTISQRALERSVGPPRFSVEHAEATVWVVTPRARVPLEGVSVNASSGRTTVRMPAREAWRVTLVSLAPKERERLSGPVFYRLLAFELAERFTDERGRAMLGGHDVGRVGRYAQRGDHGSGASGR